jgi:uncharacterized membrane protein YedE/YeeE
MFDPPLKLLLGLLTGVAFGFLLQKGRVAKFPVIVDQFLLRDWTVVKIMLTAVAVGSAGVYALVSMGAVGLHIKPALLGGVIVGGLLFGAGIALFGYCPGTSVAACGEGRRDAMIGVAGMLFGAFIYVWLYAVLAQPLTEALPDWGKITVPQVTRTSPWIWVVALLMAAAAGTYLLQAMRGRWTKSGVVHR